MIGIWAGWLSRPSNYRKACAAESPRLPAPSSNVEGHEGNLSLPTPPDPTVSTGSRFKLNDQLWAILLRHQSEISSDTNEVVRSDILEDKQWGKAVVRWNTFRVLLIFTTNFKVILFITHCRYKHSIRNAFHVFFSFLLKYYKPSVVYKSWCLNDSPLVKERGPPFIPQQMHTLTARAYWFWG